MIMSTGHYSQDEFFAQVMLTRETLERFYRDPSSLDEALSKITLMIEEIITNPDACPPTQAWISREFPDLFPPIQEVLVTTLVMAQGLQIQN